MTEMPAELKAFFNERDTLYKSWQSARQAVIDEENLENIEDLAIVFADLDLKLWRHAIGSQAWQHAKDNDPDWRLYL